VNKEDRTAAQVLIAIVASNEMQGTRVSRVLHDEVGQILSAVGLQLGVLKLDLQDRIPEIGQRTAEIQQMLERAITQVRGLSYELNPAIVERAGLQFALERLCDKYRGVFTGNLHLQYGPNIRVPLSAGNAVYRISEQALQNAVTHSQAARIEVLASHVDGGTTFEIRDNGCGFDPKKLNPNSARLGLTLMAHHGLRAGIQYTLSSGIGKGTVVKVHVPTEDQ
jgi:signal transduction histidine kinase